jgi:peptidoglycan/xylan/chitin deacetylase (PgdA/CDA1 family)
MFKGYRSPARVALTFDDGPDPDWTPLVLDALAAAGASATFFVIAPRAARYPSLVSRMTEDGHDVAFHCNEHARHDTMTTTEIEADLASGLPALRKSAPYWRTPWGLVTPATEEVAKRHRLGLVGWTADTQDWRGDEPEEMLARVRGDITTGAIILMHDGIGPGATRDGCAGTVALVDPLVALVRSRGLEPAKLGELHHPLPQTNPDFRTPGSAVRNVHSV